MNQTQLMIEYEGNAWLERNRDKMGKVDHVSEMIEEIGIRPSAVCEIGSSNGWRLDRLRKKYTCAVMGVDPSRNAVVEAKIKGIEVRRSTAENLPTLSAWADLVIYGFCLYLTEPRDWLRIVAEGDRILAYNGYLIVHDFAGRDRVEMRPYQHANGVTAYHFDFAKLWRACPLYHEIRRQIFFNEDQMITVLQKRKLT